MAVVCAAHAAGPSVSTQIPDRSGTPAQRAQAAVGLVAFLGIALGLGRFYNPRLSASWRTVVWGIALQFLFAVIVLNTWFGRWFFVQVNDAVIALLAFAEEGGRFLFGEMVHNNIPVGQPAGDPLSGPILEPTGYARTGAFFAFSVLPTIVFFASLSAVLYHTRILTWVVRTIAWIMQRSMKTSGAETLSSAANIFLGQSEAPLMVRPFLAGATLSELMAIMVGGFANIASGVLAAYVGMLRPFAPDIAGHLLAASMISAPCSLVIAKLMLPESQTPITSGSVKIEVERPDVNIVDAAGRGALEGGLLALNVAAMLIAFIALVALANALLGGAGRLVGIDGLSFELLVGYIMAPLAWLTGVPWKECLNAGSLLGIKTVLNEFVAYLQMAGELGRDAAYLSPRSMIITAYGLCGFANFASVAMQIGSIGAMAPNRRHDLSRLGIYAMIGGAISSMVTACVVGILL